MITKSGLGNYARSLTSGFSIEARHSAREMTIENFQKQVRFVGRRTWSSTAKHAMERTAFWTRVLGPNRTELGPYLRGATSGIRAALPA